MTLGSSDERAKAQSAAGLIPLQGSKYVIDSRGNYVPRVSNAPTSNTATNSYVPPTFQGTSGTVDVLNNISVNQTLEITEGQTLSAQVTELNQIIVFPNPAN
ncbi:MAG: hypothetical protein EBX13_05790, partial [Proteobacteria bacterium]|nr:hypothetical protein [Pseudomonadota bacterium]